MSEVLTSHGKFLAKLIGHSIRGTAPAQVDNDINWEAVYKLANFHNVTALIYPTLSNLDVPEHVLEKFSYDNNRLMAREARQEIEANRVFSALHDAGIPFIKLKGIVIKNLYPMPHMRTASDTDICLTKEGREKAKPIMEKLGYILDSTLVYHDEYMKDKFFIFEMHSDLLSPTSELYSMFENPFEKAVATKENSNEMVLTNEYFYLHLVVHLYKHFISEGCGLRLFSDLYIFRKTCAELDFTFITNILKEYGLLEFHNTILQLNDCFFEDNKYSDKYLALANFIFKSGEYGISSLKRISWISSSKSAKLTFSDKVRYLFGNWFPGAKALEKRYPVLKKAPFLLPVCWVRRFFYVLFFKHSSITEQKNEIKKLNSDELKEARHVQTLAGIK